ncbi:hypothetical protein N0V88_005069 [Collariella sp. IMI 366227]|nr:hypothetical protein N0V88_005069 [Collariella sp. IMI 366227]
MVHTSKDRADEPLAVRREIDEGHQPAASPSSGETSDLSSKFNHEEVVLILRAPESSGGYQVYSLVEGSTSDDSKPFSLSVTHIPHLPDRSPFLDLLTGNDIRPLYLQPPHQAHVVVSTGSGLRHAQAFYDDVLRPLLSAIGLGSTDYQTTFTQDRNTLPNFARQLGTDTHAGDKTILLLSGDGGIVDLLNVASYGFHASLVWESDTPAYRKHGAKRFGMAASQLLHEAHGYDATVEVRRKGDGEGGFVPLLPPGGGSNCENGKGMFTYVLITLVSNLERTFAISPASKPLDGRLRMVYFGEVGGEKTMEIMGQRIRGAHVGMREVGYEEVEEVKVTVEEEDARWRKVCVDGSIVELEKGVDEGGEGGEGEGEGFSWGR